MAPLAAPADTPAVAREQQPRRPVFAAAITAQMALLLAIAVTAIGTGVDLADALALAVLVGAGLGYGLSDAPSAAGRAVHRLLVLPGVTVFLAWTLVAMHSRPDSIFCTVQSSSWVWPAAAGALLALEGGLVTEAFLHARRHRRTTA